MFRLFFDNLNFDTLYFLRSGPIFKKTVTHYIHKNSLGQFKSPFEFCTLELKTSKPLALLPVTTCNNGGVSDLYLILDQGIYQL